MKIRNIIIIILCLLTTSCLSQIHGTEESELKARDFMDRAAALENTEAYHQAAQEYAMVAEHYPSTSYHKLAVWKAALLNIHPVNPEINYAASLSWLKVYLKLPLSPAEKETATFYVYMVERINDLQAELSSMVEEKNRLLEITGKQSSDIESDTKRREELEAELAHAWDELNKMKAVDVRMHRSGVEKSVDQPSQLVQTAPETKSVSQPSQSVQTAPVKKNDKGKTTLQSKQHAPAKDQEFYPYMIQVGSYKNKEDSMREAMILRDKGDPVCISHARIAGKGEWYRVLVGFYRAPEEAQKAVLELKKREYHHAFVVRPPFTVELGIFSGDEKLKKLKAHLISKGYSAYSLPNRATKNKIRLLVGAFWTEKEAETVTKDLQKEGFKPKVVRR
ncbi:MAG: SPOR domain-containing protein [Proteobacteria bacterium]|nr:SPOR domain-containing protein [Pseudomonadota bacterium]